MRTPPSTAVVVRISPTLEASPGGGSVLRSIFEWRLRLLRRGLDLFAERLVQAGGRARHPADVGAAPEADTRAAAACFVDVDPVVVRRERPADRPAGDDPAAAGTAAVDGTAPSTRDLEAA